MTTDFDKKMEFVRCCFVFKEEEEEGICGFILQSARDRLKTIFIKYVRT
jgi:hypothetical protein